MHGAENGISVTAQRQDLSLICVIMGAESRDIRNASAATLLDWGFANYALYSATEGTTDPIAVAGGMKEFCQTRYDAFSCVIPKEESGHVSVEIELPSEKLSAPISEGDVLGEVRYRIGEKQIGYVKIYASEAVKPIHFFEILRRMAAVFVLI